MSNEILNQTPGQKIRSGAIGKVALVICAVAFVTIGLLALLKPG